MHASMLKTLTVITLIILFSFELVQYEDKRNGFKILYPESWIIKKSDNPYILFKAVHHGEDWEFGMLSITRLEFNGDASGISESQIVGFAGQIGISVKRTGTEKINNKTVYWTEGLDPYDAIHLSYTYIEGKYIYMVNMGGTTILYKANFTTFKKAVKSFTLI